MLTKVHLYGDLAEKFGAVHHFDVANAPQASRALAANFKEFTANFRDGFYEVVIGTISLGEEMLGIRSGGKDIHFIPVIQGSGKGGLKVVLGIVILVAAVVLAPVTGGGSLAAAGAATAGTAGAATGLGVAAFTIAGYGVTYGSIAAFGLTMALSGISSLLTPVPKGGDYGSRNPVDQRSSFLFNGATNKSAEGVPVPLVYGRFRMGSVVAAATTNIEQL